MFTASQKKKENIAEYLLYMWHIEDIIRANALDLEKIEENIIQKYKNLSDKEKHELKEWYESLIDMMRREGIIEKGHLQINKNIVKDIFSLHKKLLASEKHKEYTEEYYKTLPYIVELRAKSGEKKTDEIETAFNALYGIMMLRIAGKEISSETNIAIKQISHFIALLSKYYRQDYNNELQDID